MQPDQVYFENCLTGMLKIPDASVDMILCDLPYGTTNCRWDIVIPFEPLWKQYKRICKPNAAICLFAQTPFDKVCGASNLEWLRYEWIWEKSAATGHLNVKRAPLKAHENILVFYNKQPIYNPQKTQDHSPVNSFTRYLETQNKTEVYGKMKNDFSGGGNTDRYPRSVLRFPSDKQKNKLNGTISPTQKPLALCKYFIQTYTNPGALVLDNCMGSFTTAIACVETGRHFIGFENDAKEFARGQKRLNDLLARSFTRTIIRPPSV